MNAAIDLLKDEFYNSKKKLYPYILQIGTGGTGSSLVQHIAQMISSFQLRGHYIIADPDVIETKNLRNQLFIEQEVGKKKADVLARRYRAAYQVDISSYSEGYIEDEESILRLFDTDYQKIGRDYTVMYLPIIIGCVDNNYSRKILSRFFENWDGTLLYIDVGNESVSVPKDFLTRPKENWTKEELDAYNESGWTGQVVCGLKIKGKTILEPVASLFPDLLEDDDELKPSELSCSSLVASDPQRVLTNKMAAMAVSVYLNELFEGGSISNHMTFFHAKKGYQKSKLVELEKPSL